MSSPRQARRHADPAPAPAIAPSRGRDNDVMMNPLHPMHRELLARISVDTRSDSGIAPPARMAIAFYAAVGSWGLAWVCYRAVEALL